MCGRVLEPTAIDRNTRENNYIDINNKSSFIKVEKFEILKRFFLTKKR